MLFCTLIILIGFCTGKHFILETDEEEKQLEPFKPHPLMEWNGMELKGLDSRCPCLAVESNPLHPLVLICSML